MNNYYILVLWIGFVIGVIVGGGLGLSSMKQKAIKNDSAYWHPQNGEFTWKTKGKENGN